MGLIRIVPTTTPPSPPAGGDVPRWTGAANQHLIDYEDYQSYNSKAEYCAAPLTFTSPTLADANVEFRTTGGLNNGKCMRGWYQVGIADQAPIHGKGSLGEMVAAAGDTVIVEVRQVFSPGYDFLYTPTGNTHKLINLNNTYRAMLSTGGERPIPNWSGAGLNIEGAQYPLTVDDGREILHVSIGGSQSAFRQNLNFPQVVLEAEDATADTVVALNDGAEHVFTERIRRSTNGRTSNAGTSGSGQGTGCIEIWVDEIKVIEYLGNDPTRPEYNRVDVTAAPNPVFVEYLVPNTRNAPPAALCWIDVRSVRIWYED